MPHYHLLYPNLPLYCADADPRALLALPETRGREIALKDAIQNAALEASFLYCAQAPSLPDADAARGLYDWVRAALGKLERCSRGIFWRGTDGDFALGLDAAAGQTVSALELPLAREWRFRVARAAGLTPGADRIDFQDTAFSFVPALSASFSGGAILLEEGGVFCFDLSLKYPELLRGLCPGFEYRFLDGEEQFLSYALLRSQGLGPNTMTLRAQFDPCRPEARTLIFIGLTGEGRMEGYFQTVTGQTMPLLPVLAGEGESHPGGLRFCPEKRAGPHPTEPIGDYCFPVGGALLCGLLGTEALEMPAGGRLRFVAGRGAYAPSFPARPLEIADFVTGLPKDLLTERHSTVWACAGSQGLAYRAQPDGSPLFGGSGALLRHDAAAALLCTQAAFPLVPVAGLDSVPGCAVAQAAEFERQILAPVRQHLLLEQTNVPELPDAAAVRTAATPMGQIVELAENGAWAALRLAQAGEDALWFEQPDGALTEAFRTGSLFLVAADPAHLGPYAPQGGPLGRRAFHNRLRLGEWDFTLPVGEGCRYNDYRCVMLVKGRAGALYDPKGDGGLVADPACWSCRDAFSSPVVDGRREAAQQSNLSNWLIRYFASCAAQTDDPYTAPFNALARDPNWRGILFLNIPIGRKNLPASLACLTMGLHGGAGLSLHHLGVRLSPVEAGAGGPRQKGESAVFGLINYLDGGYAGGAVPTGPNGAPFRTLALRVLFENSAVNRMESRAQLHLAQVLGLAPGEGSCPYSSLVLNGGGQARDDGSTCALRCEEKSAFCFPTGPLEQLMVSSATMQTIDAAADRCRFELSGRLVFRTLETAEGETRDIFSYASLPFSSLALELSSTPEGQTLTEHLETLRLEETHQIVRRGSLAENLALSLEGLRGGWEEKGPAQAGYTFLPLTGLRLSPSAAPPWHGLLCRAALGSLGELGDSAGISCKLLLAWDAAGAPSLWIALPKLLGLERVLALSVGDARLAYDGEHRSYLLTLPEISLKCLGVLKLPPSGALSCCLFGGKEAADRGLGWYAMYQNGRRLDR